MDFLASAWPFLENMASPSGGLRGIGREGQAESESERETKRGDGSASAGPAARHPPPPPWGGRDEAEPAASRPRLSTAQPRLPSAVRDDYNSRRASRGSSLCA